MDATDEEKAAADALKNEGNERMKAGDFEGAIQKYTDAVKVHKNPVFFCNRAAAYGKVEQHDLAIQDCRTALALDPQYAKAYGRMGLALSAQFRYSGACRNSLLKRAAIAEAVDAYRTALELEPANESYKNNLEIAEEKSRQPQQATAGAQGGNPFAAMMGGLGGGGAPGGFDIGQMLNNPAMMNMATQMMADGNMQQMMGACLLVTLTIRQPHVEHGPGGGRTAGHGRTHAGRPAARRADAERQSRPGAC